MELRESIGFKDSLLGPIPTDWNIKTLGDIGDVKMCKRIFSYQTTTRGDVPFYKIGTFGKEPDAYISKELFEDFKKKYSFPKKGSRLISDSGTIGRTVEYVGEDAYYQDSNIIWIENNEVLVTNKYLKHIFKIIKYNTEGSTIKRLYNSIVKSSSFALPPTLEEQKSIATTLSDVDELINRLKKLISKKKNIKQGAMQQLLTPPHEGGKRLPGFSGDWVEINLGRSSILKARIGWQGLTTAEYLNSGEYNLITGTDFKDGYIDWENCVYVEKDRFDQDKNIQVQANDVLVTKDGTIGKVAFVNEVYKPTTLNSGVFVIRPLDRAYISRFFYFILISEYFELFLSKLAAGSTISHLYQKDFIHFTFPAPPTLEEQQSISDILSDMDLEITQLETKKEKYQAIKQGMMQELLTGKIRLV